MTRTIIGRGDLENHALDLGSFIEAGIRLHVPASSREVVYVKLADGSHVSNANLELEVLSDGSVVYNLVLIPDAETLPEMAKAIVAE